MAVTPSTRSRPAERCDRFRVGISMSTERLAGTGARVRTASEGSTTPADAALGARSPGEGLVLSGQVSMVVVASGPSCSVPGVRRDPVTRPGALPRAGGQPGTPPETLCDRGPPAGSEGGPGPAQSRDDCADLAGRTRTGRTQTAPRRRPRPPMAVTPVGGPSDGGPSDAVPVPQRSTVGRVNPMTAPPPSRLAANTVPPWACTISLTMDRPSPDPGSARAASDR